MRKMWSLCLSLLVLMLLLAACGNSEKGASNSASESGAGEAPYEIKMAVINFGTDMSRIGEIEEKINEITRKEINATVSITPINSSAWQQQMNLTLASNEKLDLFVTSTYYQYNIQVAKNQLLPLDELILQHGQDAEKAVGKDILNATRVDGKIYGIPSLRDFASSYGLAMRKDLVDKYQIDLSKVNTWEDLGPVFQTILDNEKGMAPLTQISQASTIGFVMSSGHFDLLGDSLGVLTLKDNDLKVVNLFEAPEYVKNLELINEWYEKGYIQKDIATSQQTGQNMTKAGKAFGYAAFIKPGFDVQATTQTGHPMVSVAVTEPISITDNIANFMISIAKNSANPEKAMQFINLLYSNKDIVNLLDNGIEGKDFIINDDGTISAHPDSPNPYVFNQWEVGNNYLSHLMKGTAPDIWDQMKQFNDSALASKARGFSFNPEPVKTEMAAAMNVINQYRVGLETGLLDPKKNLPDFNAKLKAAGLEKIIAEKQKQLDAWAEHQNK